MRAVCDRHARVAGGDSVFNEPLMFCLKKLIFALFVASLIEPMAPKSRTLKRPSAAVVDCTVADCIAAPKRQRP